MIVCGIRDDAIRKELLQEPQLTLARWIDVCRAVDTTSAQVRTISKDPGTATSRWPGKKTILKGFEFEFEWGFYALSASKAIFRARTYNCTT